jgi:hypothetical protein
MNYGIQIFPSYVVEIQASVQLIVDLSNNGHIVSANDVQAQNDLFDTLGLRVDALMGFI